MIDLLFNEEKQKQALAHDIKGMLAVAQLTVDRLMLHEDKLVRRQCAVVEKIIHKTTQYCAETIRDMRVKPEEAISLEALVEETGFILQPFAENYSVDYRAINIDADMPAKYYTRLQRILINLGRNAIQAQKHQIGGRLVILADVDSNEISIDIIDAGPGLPRKIIKALFSEDKILNPCDKDSMGMGLTSSLSFAQEMGGEMKLVRTGSNGTHFQIKIPVRGYDA